MCSAPLAADVRTTARQRLLQAALRLIGDRGYSGTSVRSVASEAGVSPALVIHHFGSKEGLRRACDDHVAAAIKKAKQNALRSGPTPDLLRMMREDRAMQPLAKYIARTLVDDSSGVAHLVDAMAADAREYMEQGVQDGALRPTDFPYERAVLLVIWQLGAMALHRHVERLLGLDLLGDPEETLRWGRPVLEVLTHGVLADDRWERAVAEVLDQRNTRQARGREEQGDYRPGHSD